jgi:fermentation-respiration switch protein FrsA (DUF1100 family)
MRALLLLLLKLLAVGYALLLLAAWALQSRLVFFPGAAPVFTPANAQLPYRDVELVASDGVKLRAWLIESKPARGLVLFCHGNAGSREHRIDIAQSLVEMGVSVLLFDYRGYGGSEGSPSEEGCYLDAEAAWRFATTSGGFAPEKIVAWGESLGGAVAVELARRQAVRALVTESAFASLADVARVHYPWLPVRWLLRMKFDNVSKVGELRLPWLLLHSPDDEIVPFAQAERLLAAARAAGAENPAESAAVELVRTRAGHNEGGFLLDPSARAALDSFLVRVLPAGA